jgi:hypothetical protein
MALRLVTDREQQQRIDRLSEDIGRVGKGHKSNEMMMALCLALAAGITLACPREHWHQALGDVTKAIADNIGAEEFNASKAREH